MSPLVITIITLALAAGLAAGIVSYRAEKRRTLAIARWAVGIGWRFHGDDDDDEFSDRHPEFEIFQHGDDRHATNRATGTLEIWERVVGAETGDFVYTEASGAGKSRRTVTRRFSYLIVDLPFGPHLPPLVVRPERLFDKFAGAVGLGDIDFESAEFSRRFHVSGTDRRFAYALIDPRMIEFLLDVTPPRIELSGGRLLIVADQATDRWEPAEFAEAHAWTREFLSRWPTYLVRDLSGA